MTMPFDSPLEQLLETHGDVLRPLLGDLWPVRPFKVEQFGPLTKYTLGEMPDGRWAMLHRLTEADAGSPHDHPVNFTSHVIHGSYVERIWHLRLGEYKAEHRLREPGSAHDIGADCIHSVVSLPQGECWTLCFAGPVVRQWRHYPELHEAAMSVPSFASK